MKEDSSKILNQRRSIRIPGFLGARLRAGSIQVPGNAGVGDGILIFPEKAFFAVGDGSDRNPRAVRHVMKCFMEMVKSIHGIDPGRKYREEEAKDLLDKISLESSALLKHMSPSNSCTFTGILLLNTDERHYGLMLHTGDSLLYHIHAQTGETKKLTQTNFWFVGRTNRFYQIETIALNQSSRLLLATDGFISLLPQGETDTDVLGTIFCSSDVAEVPDLLFERYDEPKGGLDDAAVLCLNPCNLGCNHPAMILGGTSPAEERLLKQDNEQERKGKASTETVSP